MNDPTAYLEEKQRFLEAALERALPEPAGGCGPARRLAEAMRYAVLNGGKRIRPILCLAAAETFGGIPERALPPALAIELFHCSSLVHDDLPCMDDDDLRRGLPTCHVRFGEADAVLVGDALIIRAFRILADADDSRSARELARATGADGVVLGQVADLAAEGTPPNPELLDFIHLHKTAVLIRAALCMGATSAGATEAQTAAIARFGEEIGIAFQIEDDILDETSCDETLGKPVGSDRAHEKTTYPSVHGLDGARAEVRRRTRRAFEALAPIDRDVSRLRSIAAYLADRRR